MPTCTHLNSIDGCIVTGDNTPTQIIAIPCFEPDISMRIEVQVIARRPSNADAKTWHAVVLIDKTGGATPTLGSLINLMTPTGTLGAATWTLGITFDTNHAFVNAVGQAGATINWFGSGTGMQVMGD